MITDIAQRVYESILESGRKWRIDDIKQRPSYDDVELLVARMIDQVRRSPTPISVASGGILVQRVDNYIDVYVHCGEEVV